MRNHPYPTLLILVTLALAGCAQGVATPPPAGDGASQATPAPAIQYVDAEDVRPSRTVSDWVTYADYVAVVTVRADQLREPTKTEVERGEGSILRDLTLSVDEILWASPKATTKLPNSIEWEAIGSAFSASGKTTTLLAIRDAPRMEQNHSYILALYWHPEVCSEGDERPPFWDGLGAEGVLPYDEGSIGEGESAGVFQPVARATAQAGTVEAEFAGRDATSFGKALALAEPDSTRLAPYRDPACA